METKIQISEKDIVRLVETTDSLLDEEIIKEREKQIYEIKKDMMTLRDLFGQISGMIEIQGPDIIRVSQNIKETEDDINFGVDELEQVYNRTWRCDIL